MEQTIHYRFKQPFLTVILVNWLQYQLRKLPFNSRKNGRFKINLSKIHNFIEQFRDHRTSIWVNGECIFEAKEAMKYRPDLVEEY